MFLDRMPMPKKKSTPSQIEAEKDRICTIALSIICEEGYGDFSMRKLAARLGIAAKTIYNYYTNKDELYLRILTRGFEQLCLRYEEIFSNSRDPVERLRHMNRAYVDFGITNPDYYNIMFNWNVPKFIDYAGTKQDDAAQYGRHVALRGIDMIIEDVAGVAERTGCFPSSQAPYRTLQHWSAMHGIVSLYNSRIIPVVVNDNLDRVMDTMVSDLMNPFLGKHHVQGR